jgi:diguanylate cyclase (GGDEF)-like protein
MIEIDNFCQLNKQYDYWLGNALIKYIAKMLRNRFRRGDLIGRYHGHRFIIALNDADVDSAAHVLRQLSQEMVTTPIELNQLVLHITLSIGIAHYPGHIHFGTESNHDHLINTTEKAVTEAIQQGGNQVIIKPIADIMNSNY